MNLLLKQLLILMERKISLYGKFIVLLREEWRCIAEYSVDSIDPLLEKKDDLVRQMANLESDRNRLMRKVASRVKVAPSGLTLKKLIHLQDSPLNPRLATSRKKLLEQIQSINNLNRSIRDLMDSSSRSFRKSLVFLHSAGETALASYHANGRVAERKIQSRMLSVDA